MIKVKAAYTAHMSCGTRQGPYALPAAAEAEKKISLPTVNATVDPLTLTLTTPLAAAASACSLDRSLKAHRTTRTHQVGNRSTGARRNQVGSAGGALHAGKLKLAATPREPRAPSAAMPATSYIASRALHVQNKACPP